MEDNDFKEMFSFYRRQIEYEDSLINVRINWYLVIQGTLGAFYTFIATDFAGKREEIPASTRMYLALIIIVGILSTGYTFVSVIAATKASENIAAQCEKVLQEWRYYQENMQAKHKFLIPEYARGGGKVL